MYAFNLEIPMANAVAVCLGLMELPFSSAAASLRWVPLDAMAAPLHYPHYHNERLIFGNSSLIRIKSEKQIDISLISYQPIY